MNSSSNPNTFVDCSETIKVETVKEEINDEESVEDPLSIKDDTANKDIDNNVEIKAKVIDGDPLCVQKIHFSGDGENNTVVDNVDTVEHKIEMDYYDQSSIIN